MKHSTFIAGESSQAWTGIVNHQRELTVADGYLDRRVVLSNAHDHAVIRHTCFKSSLTSGEQRH